MSNELKIGDIVYSRMGRDSQRYFIVTEIVKDNYVKIADGEYHKLSKPKLKKIKHLKFKGINLNIIAIKLTENKTVYDSELKKALRIALETNESLKEAENKLK